MGIRDENWPATVGLFTGIFAKEAVVGTLDSIYNQLDSQKAASEGQDVAPFDFWQGVIDSFAAIPAGFEGFFDQLKDPLGVAAAVDEVGQADRSAYHSMVSHFGEHGTKAAFAYLLFILIYAPCVAALAAIGRAIGLRWMLFAVTYLTVLAWVISTAYFQLAIFTVNPAASAGWLGLCIMILITFYIGLRLAGNRSAGN